ncbi:MAG: GYD domain-containing protein [Verrucomicrobia subdivision 3 bacterium]|nr:GYD domain-containing protein [Limisphaerales bacterium]
MATFLMLGKYSSEGVKGASAARTKTISGMIEQCGGRVDAMYALLGEHDLAFIVTMPGINEATKASFAISKATGIAFSTSPAMTVSEFDRLVSD